MPRSPAVIRRGAIVILALAAADCGLSFEATRLTAPVTETAGALHVEVARVLLSDDVRGSGVGDGTALVVELTVANGGPQPYTLSTASLSCWMELDPAQPAATLSLTPAGGGEGPFPGGDAGEGSPLGQVVIPPGQTRSYWALFRGYRFPGSDAPRRITLALPGAGGPGLRLALADPARGVLRWSLPAATSGFMYGGRSTTLGGSYTGASEVSTQIVRAFRAGPALWDVGLISTVLVQNRGALISPTSSFMGTGVIADVSVPIFEWGAWQDPRRLAVYGGSAAQLLISVEPPRAAGDRTLPHVYGDVDADVGLEVDVGALRLAPSPFPLSIEGRSLPRWSVRAGYTHAWIGHGNANGYSTGFMLAW